MNLLLSMYKFFLVLLGIQILGANSDLASLFPKMKLTCSDSENKFNFSSNLKAISSFNSLYSTYAEIKRNALSALDRLAFKCYNSLGNLIYDSGDFLNHLTLPTFDGLAFKFYNDVGNVIHDSENFLNNFTLPILDRLAFKFYNNLVDLIYDSEDFVNFNDALELNWPRGFQDYQCSEFHSEFNSTAFDFRLKQELFGQHIVAWYVPQLLKNHLMTDMPTKALVMSFHGLAGCGKTYLSQMITDILYQENLPSKFVHVYYGSRDFQHEKDKEKYRKKLLLDISVSLHLCERSIFIFDGVDKMVPDVIDVLRPYIYYDDYCFAQINTTKSIYIFISNSGGEKIRELTFDAWLNSIPREDLTLSDFTYRLKTAAYNEPGGLQYSEIVAKNFIDVFLPFLPLEKDHIRQCIIQELKRRKLPLNRDVIDYVADQFQYYPPEFEVFSVSGCKKVSHKVDLYGED